MTFLQALQHSNISDYLLLSHLATCPQAPPGHLPPWPHLTPGHLPPWPHLVSLRLLQDPSGVLYGPEEEQEGAEEQEEAVPVPSTWSKLNISFDQGEVHNAT